jgi:Recombination endonuclease VII
VGSPKPKPIFFTGVTVAKTGKHYTLTITNGIPHKSCSKCKESRPYSAFHKSNKNPKLNLSSRCKRCQNYANKDSYYKYLGSRILSGRIRHLKKYSLTIESYDSILKLQGGVCSICKSDNPGKLKNNFHVDHDHSCCPTKKSCGKCIRGLLCETCNRGLGLFKDNIELVRLAYEYLNNFRVL